jgi:Xaa-Pro aminopeptidase
VIHPPHDHGARRAQVRAQLHVLAIDALVVTHPVDVRWLSGLEASYGQVLIAADPDLDRLWTDGRYAEPATATGMQVRTTSWIAELSDQLVSVIGGKRLGFQSEHLRVREHGQLQAAMASGTLVATERVLAELRRFKDAAELSRIAAACAISSAAWDWLVATVSAGLSEREIALALVRHLEDLGAQGPAFDAIVASGPNSAVPHHHPTDRALGRGELLKVDFGAKVEGYMSDCTRTLAMGEPGAQLREIHQAVREVQQAGVLACTSGMRAGQLHEQTIGALEARDLGATVHGLGHGLGLEIHETPILSSEPAAILESGFVVTVEPGIYVPGLGGVRIEDTVAITTTGPRRLTTCGHELVVL